MPTLQQGMAWFKQNFGTATEACLVGTPYGLDLLTAIAVQESFEVWGGLIATMPPQEVLALCVGDTLDTPSRHAFPTDRAALVAAPGGPAVFAVARQALVAMAAHVHAYQAAALNPDKFCHGFGIFQYDIQFCTADAEFFLQRHWGDFDACLARAIGELDAAKARVFGAGKTSLTANEMVYVAIAYNCGSANIHAGFAQGFYDADSGMHYGELIDRYIRMAAGV